MKVIRIPSNISYTNLNNLSGFGVGNIIILTNNTSQPLFLVKSESEQSTLSEQIPVLSGQTVLLENKDYPYWIKGIYGPVVVQLLENSLSSYTNVDLPYDVYTGGGQGYRRLQVDQEQASFQDNEQFRVLDRLISVPITEQVVYRFDTTYPVFIINRKLDLWEGGREYLVYPITGPIFTGTYSSIPISNVNSHLKSGFSSHPVSGVTVRRAQGVSIFNSNSVRAVNGTITLTDGNANRASANYSPNDLKSGVSAGQSFYLVLNPIGTGDTNGQFALQWEERFNY